MANTVQLQGNKRDEDLEIVTELSAVLEGEDLCLAIYERIKTAKRGRSSPRFHGVILPKRRFSDHPLMLETIEQNVFIWSKTPLGFLTAQPETTVRTIYINQIEVSFSLVTSWSLLMSCGIRLTIKGSFAVTLEKYNYTPSINKAVI